MKRVFAFFFTAALSTAAVAAIDPRTVPTQLPAAWQAKTRDIFKQAIEIPSVHNRGEVPRVANLLAARFKAAGIPDSDIHIMPYEALPGDQTAALIVRWRSPHATRKPMLILGHMDVVEAKRADWKYDPFVFREEDDYFYGRGTSDMKNGDVATSMAAIKLISQGFKPDNLTEAEFGLNADGGCAAYDRQFKPLGCGISTAEKTFQTYFFTTHNPGGHSSRPRPDNAIYELADALKALQAHRFQPMMNDASRGYFEERARQEGNSPLGQAIRRWLANPNDGAAADAIEANPLEVGLTRTRCVATMLQGGHADNALPQSAQATVNCRIMPGVQPKEVQAELQQLAGPKVGVTPDPNYIGAPTPASPLRPDVLKAVTAAIQRFHGPTMHVFAMMSDERLPVRALYDDVLHWEMVIRALAS